MENNQTVLGGIDPEISETIVTRREAIAQGATVGGKVAAALAIGSVPIALAALSREAYGQGLPANIKDVLDFALMLEIFENEFYKAVLGTSSSTAQNAAFAPVRGQVPATALPSIQQIQKHEAQHVTFLLANGATNVLNLTATSFDFSGNRGAGNGPFIRATTELAFLLLTAQAAEDTGVRAYKGQAPNLMSDSVRLEAALRIHSVEARHAAKIRRLRRQTGAPSVVRFSGYVAGGGAGAAGAANISNPPAAVVAALGLIYAGEDNTTHLNINVANLPNLHPGTDTTQAFDEPLTKDQVRTIVQPFFIPTIP
ncbi:MAG TPA: ferritin-like domain-containing protein [Gemmatimonadaceae bacterium]|nr:ferritin-like domain-containing protein [Gemmatimonadaceae bacterium]